MIRDYYRLIKPGMIYGNVITAAGGFFLASQAHINFPLFFAMLLGIALVMAGACVFNNWIDRDIDRLMERTKNRALAKSAIPVKNALIYGSLLSAVGILVLARYTNSLTVFIAASGFLFYVVFYGIEKRRSIYGTLVGSIAGAVPPLVGYSSVTGVFDPGAYVIYMIMVLWQMPHFYSIAIYRLNDYKSAKIPVLPAIRGVRTTKIHILFYIAAFILVSSMPTVLGMTGYLYFGVVMALGLWWLILCFKGFKTNDNKSWAKKMFRHSLVVITFLYIIIPIDVVLKNLYNL